MRTIKNGGVIVENKDWNKLLDLNLNGDKKIQVLNFVMDNLNDENQLHMTQKEISDKTGVSNRTVSDTMKALQEAKFFEKLQSGVYKVNSEFEHVEQLQKPQGIEVETTEVNEKLENLTIKNVIDKSIEDVRKVLEQDIDNPDTKLTKEDIKNLLDEHLKNINEALNDYNNQKEKGVSWKDRLNTFKGNLKKSFENFKDSLKQKVKQVTKTVQDTPVNLKNYVKNKLIDGVVNINNRIINKTNAINNRMEQARPNSNSNSQKDSRNNNKQNDAQRIVDYQVEYKKHLLNNFKGQQEHDVSKLVINSLDSELVVRGKPNLALALRQQVIAELKKEMSNSNDPNLDVKKFNSYLEDKSELLAHAVKHFEPLQQNQLLEEDLKFEVYKEPEKNIDTLRKEAERLDSLMLSPSHNTVETIQLLMDKRNAIEKYEETSGKEFNKESSQRIEKELDYFKEFLNEQLKKGVKFEIPKEVQEELDKTNSKEVNKDNSGVEVSKENKEISTEKEEELEEVER
ncbi:hypothetical protein COO06_08160 [Bacillus pseudomycoides]|nr:hypothetical protein COO06_08160 [Bacillus pseudomycoides]